MIDGNAIRRIAAERKLGLDLIEKDYSLGWILNGVSHSSVKDKLLFKGGTALSKVYYPGDWRISEDLDFTILDDSSMDDILADIQEELPLLVDELSGGIRINFKDPLVHPDFIRATVSFKGPITRHRTKIEVTREKFIGNHHTPNFPIQYDYTKFSLPVYTLDNILAEKLRALIERTKIRDYYDVWRLLGLKVVDSGVLRDQFDRKCKGKDIIFKNVEQFFREDLVEILEPHFDDLVRMSTEPMPTLPNMIGETRELIEEVFR